MIAVDTSTWIAFLEGASSVNTDLPDSALQDRQVVMVPPVLTEVLSDPGLRPEIARLLTEIPLVEIEPGFWRRAGKLRAVVLGRHRKARLGDALIVQLCLEQGMPVLTRDKNFRAFVEAAGLKLVI